MEAKYWKYKYNKEKTAYSMVSEDEARLGYGDKAYVSVTKDGVTIGGGLPSKVVLNTLSPVYGGIARDIPYPISMIPGPFSPPNQLPNIPLEALLPILKSISQMVSSAGQIAAMAI